MSTVNSDPTLAQVKVTVRQLLSSGRLREAQTLLESSGNAAPDAEIWMLRGAAGGMAGDPRSAGHCLREAIRLEPNWPEAHFNLGHALLGQGELHGAARAFVEAIRLRPDYEQAIAAFQWTDRRRWGRERVAVEMQNELRVVCPRSPQCVTTHVLLEQEDWFEPEIHFLRRVARPGMKAVDVGANHGVYTLTLAKAAGPAGHVWAFEPASDPAESLVESLALNGVSNVTLVRAALSDRTGQGTLLLDESPELNRLTDDPVDAAGRVETVPLSTLDACAAEFGWRDIDVLKLDAEGAEARIVEGGRAFLSGASPLVMFEVQHGAHTDLGLVARFHDLGYESYRYVPGIGTLVPWNAVEAGESPPLNLFCARSDRATELASRGLLARREELQGNAPSASGAWISHVRTFPCFRSVELQSSAASVAKQGKDDAASADYVAALDYYAVSRGDLPAPERYRALREAFRCADRAVRAGWSPEGAAALVRIASDFGLSDASFQALNSLMNRVVAGKKDHPVVPFLPLEQHFDAIPVELYPSLADWFRCSILETWVRFRSCWMTPKEFNTLARLRVASQPRAPEMERRWLLLRLCHGSATGDGAGNTKISTGVARNRVIWDTIEEQYQLSD